MGEKEGVMRKIEGMVVVPFKRLLKESSCLQMHSTLHCTGTQFS